MGSEETEDSVSSIDEQQKAEIERMKQAQSAQKATDKFPVQQKPRAMYRPGTVTEWADQQIAKHEDEMSRELANLIQQHTDSQLQHLLQESGGIPMNHSGGFQFDPVVYNPVHGQEHVMAVPNPIGTPQGSGQWNDANVERVKEDLMNEIAHLEQLEKKRQSLTNPTKMSPDSK